MALANKSSDLTTAEEELNKENYLTFIKKYAHTILYFHIHQFAISAPQIAKARRGGWRGKVTAVITDNIVK